jgi:helicase
MDKKKEYYYETCLFDLLEDDLVNMRLRYKKKPFFRGMVLFAFEGEDAERRTPVKIEKYTYDPQFDHESYVPIDLKNFKEFVMYAKFIGLAEDKEEDYAEIKIFAEGRNVRDIRTYKLCEHCRLNSVFTFLNPENLYKGQAFYVCRDCAGKELLSLMKINYLITPALKRQLTRMLVLKKEVNEVLKVFSEKFDPVSQPLTTIYDIKKADKAVAKVSRIYQISELALHKSLVDYYSERNIDSLLPIQCKAIDAGLLKDQNLLVVSATSSGKTMIGELTGLNKIFLAQDVRSSESQSNKQRSRMIYLVPIVALANMRFEEYREFEKYGVSICLKIGISHFDEVNRKEFGDFRTADITIGTYEAIDVMLRGGNTRNLNDFGTIIIDEIQILSDSERGYVVDGLIARLRMLNPKAQFLYLSATVSEPKELAKHLDSKLIEYMERPVPIERHLIFCKDEEVKFRHIKSYIREEFKKESKFGFAGQTIVFTNSRRNTERLSDYFRKDGLPSYPYHGGLSYYERKIVEEKFAKQQIAVVVTTAALAAGVDFPASQVIFESLVMGIKWLSVADFEQMCGRAGRLGKHERGKIIIPVIPGNTFSSTAALTEDTVAVSLLTGKIEPLKLKPNENYMYMELLSFISMYSDIKKQTGVTSDQVRKFQEFQYNGNYSLKIALSELISKRLLFGNQKISQFYISPLGRAYTESFLPLNVCDEICGWLRLENELAVIALEESKKSNSVAKINEVFQPENPKFNIEFKLTRDEVVRNKMEKFDNEFVSIVKGLFVLDVIELFVEFKNVYMQKSILTELSKKIPNARVSNNLFTSSTTMLLGSENMGKLGNIPRWVWKIIVTWSQELFNCECGEKPFCPCGRKNFERILITLRLMNYNTDEIGEYLKKNYALKIFRGDIIDFFEQLIFGLQTIEKIANTIQLNEDVKNQINIVETLLNLLQR